MNIVLMETAKRFLDSLPKKHQNKVYYNLNVVSAGSKEKAGGTRFLGVDGILQALDIKATF